MNDEFICVLPTLTLFTRENLELYKGRHTQKREFVKFVNDMNTSPRDSNLVQTTFSDRNLEHNLEASADEVVDNAVGECCIEYFLDDG